MLLFTLLITPALSADERDIIKSAYGFYTECHDKVGPTSEPCFYYLVGLIDAVVQFDSPASMPAHTTRYQLITIVMKYMADHPQELDQPPAFIVGKAINSAYPKAR